MQKVRQSRLGRMWGTHRRNARPSSQESAVCLPRVRFNQHLQVGFLQNTAGTV